MKAFVLLRASLLIALAALSLAASAQNLVQDPGFQAAAGAAYIITPYALGTSFDGGLWTVAAPPSGNFGVFDIDKTPGFTISDGVSASFDKASISQTLTTVPGVTYAISYDVYANGFGESVLTSFGNVTNTSAALPGDQAFYTHVSFLATATSGTTLLNLGNVTDVSIELDNVSVQAVPEPSAFAALGLGALALLRRRRK